VILTVLYIIVSLTI